MPVYSGTVGSAGGNYEAIFDGHGPQAWTDINPNSFFKDPNIHIPAADVARYKEDQDIWDLYRRPREVIYTEVHNNITYKYRLSLTFLVMPAGASSVTVTDTVGKLLGNDGVLSAADDTHITAAGVSLGKYFSVGVDSFGEAAVGPYASSTLASDAFVVTTLAAGDGVWVIRSGRCAVLPDGAIAVGNPLTFGASGLVTTDPFSSVDAALAENITVSFLGQALSTGSATLFCLADISMPERYGDDSEGSHVVDASPQA